jgi:hypothetical protein
MASNRLEMTIKLTAWAEGLAMIRDEVVKSLRDEADSAADPRVAQALRDVALRFEVGLTSRDEP